jgi:hypothetical protein
MAEGRAYSYRWMLRSQGDVGGYEREGEKAFETQQKADKWITLSLVAFLLGSFAAIAVVYFSPHKAALAPPSLSECLRSREPVK